MQGCLFIRGPKVAPATLRGDRSSIEAVVGDLGREAKLVGEGDVLSIG